MLPLLFFPFPTPTTAAYRTLMSDPASPVALQSLAATATAKRRVPPPCWSKDETLALVEAYKERWFALRRGNLKASDWDAVSATVSSVSDNNTTKSSVQCRHKIEKLRKRYRAEKQRSIKNPGRFSSSWDLYPLLDSMNFASTSVTGSDGQDHISDHKGSVFDGFCMNLKDYENIDDNSGSNLGFGRGFKDGYGSKFDFDHKFTGGCGVKLQGDRDLGFKGNKFKTNSRFADVYGSVVGYNHSFGQDVGSVGEFPPMILGDRSFMNPELKPKKYGNPYLDYDYNDSEEYNIDDGMGFQEKVSDDWYSLPQGFHPRKFSRVDRNFDPRSDSKCLNGFASCSRPVRRRENDSAGVKRCMDPFEEIASSIKLVAEGFMRMEKMKMEIVKEIEQMRMEMEMKHSEMILESHKKIVNAFSNTLSENKKRKKKPIMLSPDVNDKQR